MRSILRRGAATTVLLGIVLVASVALAAWVASGTGSGTAQADSAIPLTTSTVAFAGGDDLLYPGQSDGDLRITINNPNPYPVTVNQVASNGAVTSDAGAACDASTGVTMDTWLGSIAIAANDSYTGTLQSVMTMSNASDDSCQGATFTVPVTISGQSNA